MKNCLKCGKEFPFHCFIDGKKRNFKNRVYCLECSPFGQHNTKKLHIPETVNYNIATSKKCPRCKRIFDLDFFYIKKNGKPCCYCKQCNNIITTNRQKDIKRKCIEYKGNRCQLCGYDKYIEVLSFHHIDPDKKDFTIANRKCLSMDNLKPELDKCLLVCSNCHIEIHADLHKK